MEATAVDSAESATWVSARDVAELLILSGVSFAGGLETAGVVVGVCAVLQRLRLTVCGYQTDRNDVMCSARLR